MYHAIADLYPSRLSEVQLIQLTNDEAGGDEIVEAVWSEKASEADAEIDGYLGARYALPLVTVPALVKRLSLTITIYLLYRRRYGADEDFPAMVRRDYEDAVKMLNRISDGTITLGVQPAAPVNSERAAKLESHDRIFSRTTLESY